MYNCEPFSARIKDGLLAYAAKRVLRQIDEIYNVGVKEDGVVACDHSHTPAGDFSGDANSVSLTFTNDEGQILHFEIVPGTGNEAILNAAESIGQRPNVRGTKFVVSIDNMTHSGDTAFLRELMRRSGAVAVLQDLFHVYKKITSHLLNTHPDFKNGKVMIVQLQFVFINLFICSLLPGGEF